MPRPEGYRKAQRLMRLADRFGLPVVTLVDTPGAYPGVDAEARGQAEAIARCIETCLAVSVPLVAVIIGEGGSGGALALAAANRVLMLEHAIYSVISPEGCASILWRDGEQAKAAAEALRLTAQDLLAPGRRSMRSSPSRWAAPIALPEAAIDAVGDAMAAALAELVRSTATRCGSSAATSSSASAPALNAPSRGQRQWRVDARGVDHWVVLGDAGRVEQSDIRHCALVWRGKLADGQRHTRRKSLPLVPPYASLI